MSTAIIASRYRLHFDRPSDFMRFDKDLLAEAVIMSGERLDSVPGFYTYAIESCLLPIRKVQHELVTLYFQYIHPMFPVVDEQYFMEIHRKYRGREQFMAPSDFLIYQAITAAGFGVDESSTCNYISTYTNSSFSISVRFNYGEPHTDPSMKVRRHSLIR